MAAEFVPGDDLMTQLERTGHPFPVVQVLRWADHLLDALDYLHSHVPPVIHRDISPRNLKLTPRGQVMLIDFGRPISAAEMRVALDRARVAPHELHDAWPAVLAPSPAPAVRPVEAPTLPIALPRDQPPVPVVPSQPRAPRRWLVPVIGVAALVVVLLAFLLLRGLGSATGAPAVHDATLTPAVPTIAPRLATSTPTAPTSVPIEQAEAAVQAPTTAPDAVLAQATSLTPASAFVGELPILVTVDGTNLDKVRVARFVSGSGAVILAEMQTRVDSQLKLSIRALPEPIHGEVNYALQLDGVVQKVPVITLRDYRERKSAQGVLADYSYTSRVVADETGVYTRLLAEAVAGSSTLGKLHNGAQVDVLRNDLADWYQVRIATSADPAQAGLIGWVERWLIDNQSPPPAPTATPAPTVAVQVFVGRVYSAPTDAAVQCGTAFDSSIYGSIETSGGKGIAGAVVRVTSADGRNSYTLTTGRGGVYNVGGLGCTTWTVQLISVPKAKIQANPVTVGNLNGGRFTSAEVRFKLRN